MGKKDFDRMLDQKQKKDQSIDWKRLKSDWIDYVSQLYNFVEKCLESYIQTGKVQVRREHKSITEESIGTYRIEKAAIEIGNDTIVLEPIGILIIGAFGRVDIKSLLGTATLVLVPDVSTKPRIGVSVYGLEEERERTEAEQKVWKISTEPPNISYLELTEDRFFDIIVELLGGEATF